MNILIRLCNFTINFQEFSICLLAPPPRDSGNVKDTNIWADNKSGISPGSQGLLQFRQQAAALLTNLPFSVLFTPSRLSEDLKLEIGKSPLAGTNNTGMVKEELDSGKQVIIDVKDDKIVNLYAPDGDIDLDVLSACLTKLDKLPCVVPVDSHTQGNLPSRHPDKEDKHGHVTHHRGTTGRDRLLDYMARKAREARKNRDNVHL